MNIAEKSACNIQFNGLRTFQAALLYFKGVKTQLETLHFKDYSNQCITLFFTSFFEIKISYFDWVGFSPVNFEPLNQESE